MATGRRRGDPVGPKTAKFFKIIVKPGDFRLRIPAYFARRYGHNLPKHVIIRDPEGLEWGIGVVHSDGEIWLQNGMQELEYYKIELGHLLVFHYDFGSHFDVYIFDMSATEIDYAFDAALEPKREINGSESDSSVQILENLSTTIKTEDGVKETKRKRPKLRKSVPLHGFRSKIQNDYKETSKAYKKAVAFKDKNTINHLSFVSFMQPSYISSSVLSIPTAIVKCYLLKIKNDVKLHVSKGRIWAAKCTYRGKNSHITAGWRSFVKDNGLKIGDACVFELNQSDKRAWNVTIFRN